MMHVDPRNPTAAALAARLKEDLPEFDRLGVELVLGGDGFMLHTIDVESDHVWLGLNAGRIGFLMNDTDAWHDVVGRLRRHAWTAYAFPVLHAEVSQGGRASTIHALNDVSVERCTGQTAHLRVEVDGREVVERLVADGLVVSTALGTTAYTFSAGGPAAHPLLSLLAVTAVAAHHPRLSPFLLPDTAEVRIDVLDAHRRPVRVVADGADVDEVDQICVRQSRRRVQIAWLEGHDHTARVVSKILRP